MDDVPPTNFISAPPIASVVLGDTINKLGYIVPKLMPGVAYIPPSKVVP